MEDQERIDYEADIKSLLDHNRYLACKKQKSVKIAKMFLLSPIVFIYLVTSLVICIFTGIFNGLYEGIKAFTKEFKKFAW
jgi:hypothetical protein